MCVHYRALNTGTSEFYWPLPKIQDLFCTLGGARYFSSLDFIKGYHQIEMDDESKSKTVFVCEHGLFKRNVLPFGLAEAPNIYQQTMTNMLNGLNSFCLPYLDDIIIWSKTFEEHLSHLGKVFDRIRKANMKLKASKCEILKPELHYPGHIITNDGELKVDQSKVEVTNNLPAPKSVKDVR